MQIYSSTPVQFGGIRKAKNGKRLIQAIKQGDTQTAKDMLAKGVDPINAPTTIFPNLMDSYGHPFLSALRENNFELAKLMIDQYGVRLDDPMCQQWHREHTPETTLMDEVLQMSSEALAFILKEGADPNEKSQLSWAVGKTPLEVLILGAAGFEDDNMLKKVKLLLQYGAKDDVAKLIERTREFDYQINPWEKLRLKTIALLEDWLRQQEKAKPESKK